MTKKSSKHSNQAAVRLPSHARCHVCGDGPSCDQSFTWSSPLSDGDMAHHACVARYFARSHQPAARQLAASPEGQHLRITRNEQSGMLSSCLLDSIPAQEYSLFAHAFNGSDKTPNNWPSHLPPYNKRRVPFVLTLAHRRGDDFFKLYASSDKQLFELWPTVTYFGFSKCHPQCNLFYMDAGQNKNFNDFYRKHLRAQIQQKANIPSLTVWGIEQNNPSGMHLFAAAHLLSINPHGWNSWYHGNSRSSPVNVAAAHAFAHNHHVANDQPLIVMTMSNTSTPPLSPVSPPDSPRSTASTVQVSSDSEDECRSPVSFASSAPSTPPSPYNLSPNNTQVEEESPSNNAGFNFDELFNPSYFDELFNPSYFDDSPSTPSVQPSVDDMNEFLPPLPVSDAPSFPLSVDLDINDNSRKNYPSSPIINSRLRSRSPCDDDCQPSSKKGRVDY